MVSLSTPKSDGMTKKSPRGGIASIRASPLGLQILVVGMAGPQATRLCPDYLVSYQYGSGVPTLAQSERMSWKSSTGVMGGGVVILLRAVRPCRVGVPSSGPWICVEVTRNYE